MRVTNFALVQYSYVPRFFLNLNARVLHQSALVRVCTLHVKQLFVTVVLPLLNTVSGCQLS